jgi:hypothetical protein
MPVMVGDSCSLSTMGRYLGSMLLLDMPIIHHINCTSHMFELTDSVIFRHMYRLCVPSSLSLMEKPGFKASITVN